MSGARCPCCDYDVDDCECSDRWPEGRPQNNEREILRRAVDWWLNEGMKGQIGAPEWVFAARQLLDG